MAWRSIGLTSKVCICSSKEVFREWSFDCALLSCWLREVTACSISSMWLCSSAL